MKKILFIVLVLSGYINVLMSQTFPYLNTNLSPERRAEDLCSRLTLEEKVSLMQDKSPAIPRLGIPCFEWWNEALHGVARNGTATVFPNTTGMAASWDDELLFRVFDAVSDEARAKNNMAKQSGEVKMYQGLSFWTPNINIFRDPRWGRGQETYGEDPYLTSKMGLAVVRGLQGADNHKHAKLLACAKHFAVHSGPEWNRHTFNIENLPARDLWETYLSAFKTLVQDGNVKEVMCAYHSMDGEPCCGNTRFLQEILRNEWRYKGLVTSDCYAINDFYVRKYHGISADAHEASAKAVRAGTDLECGNNYATLPEAIAAGEITEQDIDVSLERLLKARFELGDFDPDEMVEWTKIPQSVIASKEHKQLALDMARKSMTLLLNKNNILPLKKEGMKIAVMGPNANDSTMLWGNYNGFPAHTVTILEGIKDIVPDVKFIQGCGHTENILKESRFNELLSPDGQKGLRATYWNSEDMTGTPATTVNVSAPLQLINTGGTVFAPGVNLERFSAKFEGFFFPAHNEHILFTMKSDDGIRLIVNGDTLYNRWKSKGDIVVRELGFKVEAGKKYPIQLDYVQHDDLALLNFDLIHRETGNSEAILQQAEEADVVIFVGGISPALEGEEKSVREPGFKGGDRLNIELPQSQRDIMTGLHAMGKKVILVNCSGGAVGLVPEMENVDAILQAWYAGEQGGKAVADVLFGEYNPGGKLPVTFYKNVEQLPDYEDYRMTGRTYRYFKGEPLFPFGYGLSYTQFVIKNPQYDAGKGVITLQIANSGARDGDEVIQVYIRNRSDANGPLKTLRGFKRVSLKAGEKKKVTIDFPKKCFESWDESTGTMRVMPGSYEIMAGSSSADNDLQKFIVNIK
jgi:beta-glucosidase